MRNSRPRPIDSIFIDSIFDAATTHKDHISLLQIKQRAIMLLNLDHVVNMLLPVPLRPWCRVANVRNGVLVLETSNASWQMRLRYEQPKLLSELRTQILSSLLSIDIRINPGLVKKRELEKHNNDRIRQAYQRLEEEPWHLSIKSAASIRHVAERSEGKLKNALKRLAELAE